MSSINKIKSIFKNLQVGNNLNRFLSLKYILVSVIIFSSISGMIYMSFFQLNAAEAIVKSYLNASTLEEKLKYVRNPEHVKPLMKEWYKNIDLSKSQPFLKLVTTNKKIKNLAVGDWAGIMVIFEEGKSSFGKTIEDGASYLLLLTETGFKIDWESSVVYNPMTFRALKAQRPTHSQKFRVMAELTDYYNFEFRDGGNYLYSILLSELDGTVLKKTGESLYGYIRKNSKDGARLYELLKDGEKHAVMLNIRYSSFSENSDQVIIDKFIQIGFNEVD